MAGGLTPRQTKRGRRRSLHINSDINVVPFLDVMLVLLIIFMVTAPMLTVGIPVELPQTQASQANETQEDPIVVTLDAEGHIYVQEMIVASDELSHKLKALTQDKPNTKIYVRGDKNISYGKVIALMGTLSSMGLSHVSLIAEPLPKQ